MGEGRAGKQWKSYFLLLHLIIHSKCERKSIALGAFVLIFKVNNKTSCSNPTVGWFGVFCFFPLKKNNKKEERKR